MSAAITIYKFYDVLSYEILSAVAATIGNSFLNSFIGIISSSGHETTATTIIVISILMGNLSGVCGYFISLPVLVGYSGPQLYSMSLSLSLSSKYFVPSLSLCGLCIVCSIIGVKREILLPVSAGSPLPIIAAAPILLIIVIFYGLFGVPAGGTRTIKQLFLFSFLFV